mgnify:CR=1 FL=1
MIEETDKTILIMLSNGYTYTDISNCIGLANRTIEQRIMFVKEIFDATTLFELAYKACKQGII